MNRLTSMRPRPSAIASMARWSAGFPIVARLRRELLKEFARSIWSASRDSNTAEPRVRGPQSNLPLSHPASFLPPLPGSHAAGLVPPGRPHPIRHGGSTSHQNARAAAATVRFGSMVAELDST
jgi:hypothetical protein